MSFILLFSTQELCLLSKYSTGLALFPSLALVCALVIRVLVVSRNSICGYGKEKQITSIFTHCRVGWIIFKLAPLTIATVLQIGPDYIFLREAEHAQSPTSHAGVNYHPCVGHQVGTLKEASPGSHTKCNCSFSPQFHSDFGSDCWCMSGSGTWYIQPVVCAEGTSDRRPCPSSQHSWGPSTGDGPDLRCLLCARGSSSDIPQDPSWTSQPSDSEPERI